MIDITLLTQDECGFCDHAKTVLRRLAQEFPLQVTEIGLAGDEGRRLAAHAGVLFAPGLLVNGQPFGHGRISERKLRHTLTKLTQEGIRS